MARDPDPTLGELLSEAWDAFVSVDGRVLSSLRLLLFHPGALTVEYLRGRRTRYLAPLRLYLLCSVAYFLLASVAPDHRGAKPLVGISTGADTFAVAGHQPDSGDRAARRLRRDSADRVVLSEHGIVVSPGPLDSAHRAMGDSIRTAQQLDKLTLLPPWVRKRMVHGVNHVVRDDRGFAAGYREQLPRLMFVLMPVLAVFLGWAYRSRRRRYPVHLIVSLHLHSFVFAMMAASAALDWVPGKTIPSLIGGAGTLWCAAYMPMALRRVYGGRLSFAVMRACLLGAEYAILAGMAFGVLALGMLLVY
jgi:Protein of unknown function (DUF3667).